MNNDALNTMIQLAASLQAEKDALRKENEALKKFLGNLGDGLVEMVEPLEEGQNAAKFLDTTQADLIEWIEEIKAVLPGRLD
jgi:vacuolar-type H+-ATPase subunit E/Vma4